MKKNHFLFLFALMLLAGKTFGQQVKPCYTDEMRKQMIITYPDILKNEALLETQIQKELNKIDYSKAARTTDESGNADFWYDIPIVIHIVHDYGDEYLTDSALFDDLKDWNIVYAKQNWDTSLVIPTFVPWIGTIHIRLHLATIDPLGNPTKGITRRRSYLTYIGGEQSKVDDWPSTSYVNIWVVNTMSLSNNEAAAYAFEPPEGGSNPQGDGIIALYNYMRDAYDGADLAVSKTIPHEMGHIFNLYHPWGNNNGPENGCGDDGVDDTPPTHGHLLEGCVYDHTALYDTDCATNYYKIYTNIAGTDSLVNYPDTTNAQNIMDYTYCARMFTIGQAARMHAALNSDIGSRDNLWTPANLTMTGALAAVPDLKPIPEFSATVPGGTLSWATYKDHQYYYVFPGTNSPVTFHNESWNDTVTAVNWQFGNSATPATSTSTGTVAVTFASAGWADVKMTATGNNTGDSTIDYPRSIYVANTTATPGIGYVEEFSGADTTQWPIFNYYNNEFHWQVINNLGYDDNSCVMYTGFDSRINLLTGSLPYTGTPQGDFDDMFSIPMDLSGYGGGPCSLNFYYTGASRSSFAYDLTDSLVIDYAIGKTNTWFPLATLANTTLCNKGYVGTAYAPTSPNDWSLFSINLPAQAKNSYVVFRFRYKPNPSMMLYTSDGTNYIYIPAAYSTGNNFYMDRFTVSPYPAGVGEVKLGNMDAVVAPNPTVGDAYVIVKDQDNATANVVVTDITGKLIYTTSQAVINSEARILIPHAVIAVPGMYIVQTTTGGQVHTQKLVVE